MTADVLLKEMGRKAYEVFYERTIREFAADSVEAGRLEKAGSEDRVKKMFSGILPEGRATAGHSFMSIISGDEIAGELWYFQENSSAFIYDIHVGKKFRNMGLGTAALRSLENTLKSDGISKIKLHVFGHNTGARRLYERTGYIITGVEMEKIISQ